MLAVKTKRYLTISLSSAPKVLTALVSNASIKDFDRKVDPERFTLREMLAHLGDWEAINLSRLIQLRDEDNPTIQGIDEGVWAVEHGHDKTDPYESLAKYAEGRVKLIEFIGTLTPDDWLKAGIHTEAGPIVLAELLVLISAHDGYHQLQAVEFLNA